MTNPPIIFFGNQKLVQGIKKDVTTITEALATAGYPVITTITTKEDLKKVPIILKNHPTAIAVLASFGFIVPKSIITLFEPLGILNLHPSLLPKYRGSTPIESAILNGDTTTSISIMKLVSEMDAGPLYAQKTLPINPSDDKFTLANKLAHLGATTLIEILNNPVKTPIPQSGTPTYTAKLSKSLSPLTPKTKTATQLDREVRAYLNFPKSKYTYFNLSCTILKAHVSPTKTTPLDLKCIDNSYLVIDQLLPENSKPMSTADFLNGHAKP